MSSPSFPSPTMHAAPRPLPRDCSRRKIALGQPDSNVVFRPAYVTHPLFPLLPCRLINLRTVLSTVVAPRVVTFLLVTKYIQSQV